MHWAPQDWLASPLRAQLALERDHVTRLLYRELLDALHAAGGRLRRSEIAGAVLMTPEEVEPGLKRLVDSGRLKQVGEWITNPRVQRDINKVVVERKRDAERKRLEREEKDSKSEARNRSASVRGTPGDSGGLRGTPDVSGAPAPFPTSLSPFPTSQASSVPADPPDQAVADGPSQHPADTPPAGQNGGQVTQSPDPEEQDRFWKTVWMAWCAKRGGNGREPDNVEFALARRWLNTGVPLRIVLRGIEDCSSTNLGPTKRLTYVGPAVDEAIDHWRRSASA